MVTATTLKAYNYSNVVEYWEHITSSAHQGQKMQVQRLFKKLSKEQRIEFLKWLFTQPEDDQCSRAFFMCIEVIY